MDEILMYLREFNFASVAARLVLAMMFGGMLGINRAKKRRAAGFRTYMLVCLGATLAMILGQYETELLFTHWGVSGHRLSTASVSWVQARCL